MASSPPIQRIRRTGQMTRFEPLAGHQKYEKLGDLGEGAFGVVQLARNKMTGEEVAIKFLPRGQEHVTKHVLREILSHSLFCHPHVVLFREVFLTETHLGIALEYAAGGDLYQYVRDKGALDESEARRFFQQLIVALDYCHQIGVVNRDIKLENTLLDARKSLIKITDFGYAKGQEDSVPISNVGTPNYAAPEVISASRKRYDGKQADVWSCGVMLYVMLFHSYPFERPGDPPGARGFAKVLDRTIKVDYKIPSRPKVSDACVNFLGRLLVKDPAKRITIEQIYQHPWFKHGFPASAGQLNKDCLALRPTPEEAEKLKAEIKRIVSEASGKPGEPPRSGSHFDIDAEISEAWADRSGQLG